MHVDDERRLAGCGRLRVNLGNLTATTWEVRAANQRSQFRLHTQE